MIDYHTHILPGLDDGAADMDEAVAIARVLAEAGYTTAYCTPHQIKGCYDSNDVVVRKRMEELRVRLQNVGIGLQLHTGSEYYLDEYLMKGLKDCVTLQDSQFLLMEISSHMPVEFIQDACYRIRCRGYVPVIAHPERCRVLELSRPVKTGARNEARGARSKEVLKIERGISSSSQETLLDYLVEIGCRFQGNIGSFAGIYGDRVRGRAITYLRGGIYCCLGSDAHSSKHFGEWLEKGLHEIEWDIGTDGLRDLLEWVPFGGGRGEPGAGDWGLGAGNL